MIGKFINPISSSGSPAPSSAGIYIVSYSSTTISKNEVADFKGFKILNSDLSVDTTFDLQDTLIADSSFTFIGSVDFQSDGKYLLAGNFRDYGTIYNRVDSQYLIRVNPDGSIDSAFSSNIGNSFNNFVNEISLDATEKILAIGSFTSFFGTSRNRIARLNSDGTLDTSFVVEFGFNSTPYVIRHQSDGKILVGGIFTSYNLTTVNRIVRLNSDGSIDSSFTIGTGFNNDVKDIQIDSTGKIYVGGSFTSYNGVTSTANSGLVRLNSDGTIDSTFTKTINPSTVETICLQSDGKIVVGGSYCPFGDTNPCGITRFNSDGSLDNTFQKPGFYSSPTINRIIQDSNGKLVVCGAFDKYNYTYSSKIIRLNTDGTVDTAFDNFFTITSGNSLQDFKILPSGKICIVGSSANIVSSRTSPTFLTKLSSYNTIEKLIDLPLSYLTSIPNYPIEFVKDNNDNFYLFSQMTGNPYASGVLKLDSSFNLTNDPAYYLRNLYTDLQTNVSSQLLFLFTSDEKIFVSGNEVNIFNDQVVKNIFRMNSDFTIDPTFDLSNGFVPYTSNFAIAMFETADNKYFIFSSSQYNGATRDFFRINNDGSVDNTFSNKSIVASSGPRNITSCVTEPDGKILVGGNFTTFGGAAIRYMVRLNSNGTIDSSFDAGDSFTDFDGGLSSFARPKIKKTSDGKYIIVSNTYGYQGVKSPGIVKINSDGSIDTTFSTNLGDGFDRAIDDFAIDSTDKIYLIGEFTKFNGNKCRGYCVLNSDGTFLPTGIDFPTQDPVAIAVFE